MEENKNEEVKEEKVEVVDAPKTEEAKSNNSEDITKDVLYKPIVFAIIVTAVAFTHSILFFIHGNLAWLIINAVCVAGCLVGGLLALKFFLAGGKDYIKDKNKGKVLAAWIILVATMALAAVCTLAFSIDMIRNLIGVIHGNI